MARAGHRNGASRSRSTEQSRPSGTAQANSGGQAASTPPHVAAVDVRPAPGDDGLTGVELPDATDDGDEYLDEDGAAFGFGFTVLPHVNGSSDGYLDVSPEAALWFAKKDTVYVAGKGKGKVRFIGPDHRTGTQGRRSALQA